MVMGIFKSHEGVKLNCRDGISPFAVAPLRSAHALAPEEQEALRGSVLPRGCFNAQRLKGAARDSRALLLLSLSQTGSICISSQPASSPKQSVPTWEGNGSDRANIFHLSQFSDEKGRGGLAEEQQILVLERELSPTQSLPNSVRPGGRWGSGAQLCRCFLNLVVYLLSCNCALLRDLQDCIKQNTEMLQVSHLKWADRRNF